MKFFKQSLLISLLYSQSLFSNTLENFSENSKLLEVSISPYGDTLTLISENKFGEEVLYLIDANEFEENKLTVINSFGAPNLRQDGGYSITGSSICGVTWSGPEDFMFQICGKTTRNEARQRNFRGSFPYSHRENSRISRVSTEAKCLRRV